MQALDFIETARDLTTSSSGRPRQSNLRRAVSTTYYALFHCLATCCADMIVGGAGADRSEPAWRQAYRALDHGPVRTTAGRRAARRPERVDQTLEALAPTACPDCGGSVEVTHVASQYQEEIPEVRSIVRRFDIEVGRCSQCQRRVQGRHALQTSDALGAAGAQLGPGVVALVVELHTEMGVPLGKVAHVLRTTFGLQVTPGGLTHLLHRVARDATPTYTALCEQVRNAAVVTPDETGWRVGALGHWLWAWVTPETTVYAICPGRGFDDATTVLGADFSGVLVRDGWVSYRCYRAALHQSCLNHLLRRCKELQEDHPHSLWAGQVQAVLQMGLAVRDRCNDGKLSEHGLASVRGRLVARLGRLIDAPPPLDETPSALPGTWPPNSLPCFSSCGTFRLTPPIGAPNRPSGPRSSPARYAVATAPARAPTPSRCWPASCAPPANATSLCLR